MTRRPLALLFMLALSRTLAGQVPTDEIAAERVMTPRETVDQEIAESRFHLGPLRLTPALVITDATYDNNVYGTTADPVGDFRMTVAAGLGLVAPLTPDLFLRGTVLPSYTWYASLEERRFFGGEYGGSVIAFANRLSLEGGGGYSKKDVLFSTENQQRVIQELSQAGLGAEFRLLTRFYLYGGGRVQWFRYSGPGAPGAVLNPTVTDRTTYLVRAELRYKVIGTLTVAAGAEQTQAEFVHTPEQYDNRTRAVIGSLYYEQPKFFVNFTGGYREGKPIHGSTIPPFSGFTGGGAATYSLLRWLELNASGGRTLSYGTSSPYYIVTRYRGGLTVNVGWRLRLQGFGEWGDDSYTTPTLLPDGQLVTRKDDVTSYGGILGFLFTSRLGLNFAATESRYNSNVPGNDRSYFRWSVSLGVGGNLLR